MEFWIKALGKKMTAMESAGKTGMVPKIPRDMIEGLREKIEKETVREQRTGDAGGDERTKQGGKGLAPTRDRTGQHHDHGDQSLIP